MVIMPIYNEFGLIEIDEARIDETCSAYFKWKDLNTYISNNSRRGINMPDAISEPMGCYCLGYLWNRGSEAGDATDPATNRKIEFKATSRFEGDLSSFGPKCTFDDLVFLRFNLEENLLYIYDFCFCIKITHCISQCAVVDCISLKILKVLLPNSLLFL